MLQTRPSPGQPARLVSRERLLRLLPDAPGHVVWLHAPAGYGKSILTSQWAGSLEESGWRVLWTAGGPVRESVTASLQLPATAPWPVVRAELARTPTLLVLEDLQGDEELEQLLRANSQGLTLLASRTRLAEPDLIRLHNHGQLLVLDAAQLAFSLQEAEQLGAQLGATDVARHWSRTGGWPLLLHFGLLTDDSGTDHLHTLLRRSVSSEAWHEALFLAAVGSLPHAAASGATQELAAGGFLQRLEHHYRLHPLVAQSLLDHQKPQVQDRLELEADRLDHMDRLRASHRAGHLELLRDGLDTLPLAVVGENCNEYLQLSPQAPGADHGRRGLREAYARVTGQPHPSHAQQLLEALKHTALPPAELLEARLLTAVMLARVGSHDAAADTIGLALTGLAPGPSLERARLLAARVLVDGYAGRYEQALAVADEAHSLGLSLASEEGRTQARMALQHASAFRFELTGDAEEEARIFASLAQHPGLDRRRRSQLLFNVALNLVMDLQDDAALEAARTSAEDAEPFWRLWANVLIAYITCDLQAFPDLFTEAGRWGMNDTNARVGALWLRACRKAGDLSEPLRIAGLLPDDPFIRLEFALHHHAEGRHEQAAQLLQSARGGYRNREFRQHELAASFLLSGDPAELDALLELSAHPERLVRYVLLPLESLPRDRPELAIRYPLVEVLASGWQEAIALRHAEIPALNLQLLGGFRIVHLDNELKLPARQQQLLTLLALGADRNRIATELWPEASAASAANNLNVQLHTLRRTLEPWGLPTYLSNGGLRNTETDVQALRQAIKVGDADAAMSLYRGDICPELDTGWLLAEREQLRRETIRLLLGTAADSAPPRAIPFLERVLELEPLHDEAVGLLTTSLIRIGRRDAARRLLHDYGRLLARETGLQPTAELMSLLDA